MRIPSNYSAYSLLQSMPPITEYTPYYRVCLLLQRMPPITEYASYYIYCHPYHTKVCIQTGSITSFLAGLILTLITPHSNIAYCVNTIAVCCKQQCIIVEYNIYVNVQLLVH